MGKKKKSDTDNAEEKVAISLEDQIIKKFGEGILVTGNHIVDNPQTIIPVSPAFDIMLNGGIPFGSFVIPTGKPKTGKTSFSMDLAATALRIPTKFDVPRKIYYSKVEGRLQKRDLEGIHHLKDHINTDVEIITSRRGKILNAEDFLEINEQLMNEKPGSIFIIDSLSQLCTSTRHAKDWDDGKAFRDNLPVMLSNFCKRVCQVIPVNESLFIGITHQIADTGMSFTPFAEAGGNKIQYQVDVKLKAKYNKPWKLKEDDPSKLGIMVFWECFSAPLQNGPAVEECESRFRFGWGIDKHLELINIGGDLGIIPKAGTWYTIGDNKVQGKDKARNLLLDDPDSSVRIYQEIREAMGMEPVPEEYIRACL